MVKRLQKLAGILKEDDFDLSDNPLSPDKRDVEFEDVVNSGTFLSIGNGSHYFDYRIGFADIRGVCYIVELDGPSASKEPHPLKKGLTVEKVIKDGLSRRILDKTHYGELYYRAGDEFIQEFEDWIESLKD